MNFTLSYAAKNLLRYKRRTILTFLVLSFGVAVYIFYTSLLDGFSKSSFENMINFETGHIKIRSKKFDKNTPYSLTNLVNQQENNSITAKLLKQKFITGVTSRLFFQGEADNGRDATPCIVAGIDLKTDAKVFTLLKYIRTGSITSNGALIGSGLAKSLHVKTGDSLYLTFRRKKGMFDSVPLQISGIIQSADPQANNSYLFISLKYAQALTATKGVTEISIKTTDHDQHNQFLARIKKITPNYQTHSWWELAAQLARLSRSKEIGSYVFVFFLSIIAIVGIVNTMLLSVYEKKKEIGTLKALGATDTDIKKIFLTEGAIIGTLGSIAGIILGCLINWYFCTHGFDISAMVGEGNINIGFKVLGIVKSRWSIEPILLAFFLSIAASILASLYPAQKTTKLQPAETLRTIQ